MTLQILERTLKTILRHIDQSAGLAECWPWTGAIGGKGNHRRGVAYLLGQYMNASRASWIIWHRRYPKNLVLHCCPGGSNSNCCNPFHLYDGTFRQNIEDARREGHLGRGGGYGDKNGSHTHPERVARGEHHGRAKLLDVEVIAIKQMYASGGYLQKELAALYHISKNHCGQIIRGERCGSI